MGSSGGGGTTQVVQAEEVVTPAVAKSVERDTESAQAAQAERRNRLRGIRSTYSRFAAQGGGQAAGATGSASKLG